MSERRALVAPDKFKGTMTAAEVAAAIASGIDAAADICPVADGGDGTAAVLVASLGGEWVEAPSHDPIGRPITARYAVLEDGAALVEVAAASGLALLAEDERDALAASSAGTGELIAHAIARGCERVLVAVGGSATTDAGLGALGRFDPAGAEIVCLCDIDEPFAGAMNYAPQKGASGEQFEALEARLAEAALALPRDPSDVPGAGAAGGLAGGLWAHGAELVPGAPYVLNALGFDERLATADLVITGEGRLDATSVQGKAVSEVARRAARAGVPVHAIVGSDASDEGIRAALGLASILTAGDPGSIARAAATL